MQKCIIATHINIPASLYIFDSEESFDIYKILYNNGNGWGFKTIHAYIDVNDIENKDNFHEFSTFLDFIEHGYLNCKFNLELEQSALQVLQKYKGDIYNE